MSLSSGGKRTKQNRKALKQLKQEYLDRGYTDPPICEAELSGCLRSFTVGFCHKHKRKWYYSHPELLGSFQQTILACTKCHNKLEPKKTNKELIKRVFNRLRPL